MRCFSLKKTPLREIQKFTSAYEIIVEFGYNLLDIISAKKWPGSNVTFIESGEAASWQRSIYQVALISEICYSDTGKVLNDDS